LQARLEEQNTALVLDMCLNGYQMASYFKTDCVLIQTKVSSLLQLAIKNLSASQFKMAVIFKHILRVIDLNGPV